MDIHTQISLKNYTTMRLGGPARFMVDVHSIDEVISVYENANSKNIKVWVLGGGSNTIVNDAGFDGLVIHNRIKGIDLVEDTPSYSVYKVGGGEIWDDFVKKTVDDKLSGIEALSAIPGTVGASPVQNIGAYGQEVSDCITSVEVYDTHDRNIKSLSPSECKFSYRHSIFRGEATGSYFIVSVTFKLSKNAPSPPFYDAVQKYLDDKSVSFYTSQAIRDAVMAIRFEKLPDPNVQPNSGSFFKNAIIEDWLFNDLIKKYPDMPNYQMPDKMHKIPTGWLIEMCGYKGKVIQGIKIHDKNALVLINQSAQSYGDLDYARSEIKGAVRDMFQINIEQEPLEI
jgi:UDP-N-acetylmuramate dehydrogenase